MDGIAPDRALGAVPGPDGVDFAVWSGSAEQIWLCLYEGEAEDEAETQRIPMQSEGGLWTAHVPGLEPGALYGFRADGPYAPDKGLWFDPAKLLADPYALHLDRPFAYDSRLGAARQDEIDTAPLMPKSVVSTLPDPCAPEPPRFRPGGLIYELQVRGFTKLHPYVPERLRGTIAALAHPVIIEHLTQLGVDAVELMPVNAWIDERHLHALGLRNAWGYNPVTYLAPDPRLCPGGLAELAATTAALHEAGIGVILDVVYNHTGESDMGGPTLSLRGLDAPTYFRHEPDGSLVNDTGTGNTLACDHPVTLRLVLDSMRHFVTHAGIDGFRFDLAPILGRTGHGFDPRAQIFTEITSDPVLHDRIMIAEPWDIGPGGYQLGNFPPNFLEWNDRYRDRIRRFWRGDAHMLGELASAVAGSSDAFAGERTRSVNFIAAHDGFTLADLVSHKNKHNEANGEQNRDGHGENHSWNNGSEGPTEDADIQSARTRDLRALLASLFASRGAIMLTAGDEFGRSQQGNNNAYAQDNEITWIDWQTRDRDLEAFCAKLSHFRRDHPALSAPEFLNGNHDGNGMRDVEWLNANGHPMEVPDWEAANGSFLAMILRTPDGGRTAVLLNRSAIPVGFNLPHRKGWIWQIEGKNAVTAGPRSVCFFSETPGPA